MSAFDAYLEGANIRPPKERPPFLADGDHVLDVVEMREVKSRKSGHPNVWVEFLVHESSKLQPGTRATLRYDLGKQEMYAENPTELERMIYMFAAMIGTKDLALAKAKLKAVHPGTDKAFVGVRGLRVVCNGRMNTKGTWCQFNWQAVQQTKDEVAARRAKIDALASAPAAPAPAPVAPPPAVSAPAPRESEASLDDLFAES